MEYLDSLDEEQREVQLLQQLRDKKQQLQQQLDQLNNQQYDIDADTDVENTDDDSEVNRLTDILDTYRILGVSIHSMAGDMVVRFDPIYRDQYPAAEHYCVQFVKKGDNFTVGQHNLPPFIPVHQLEEEHLALGVREFVDKVNDYLRAYVYRREGVKHCQEVYKDLFTGSPSVNLSVTYVHLRLVVDEELPNMDVTLQYCLLRSLPDSAELKFEESEDSNLKKKKLDRLLTKWRLLFLKEDMYTAISAVVGRDG